MCVKKIWHTIRTVFGTDKKRYTTAIIVAAGLSQRFGGIATKQMTELCGKPILVHTLLAYEQADCIHDIIIVAREEEIPAWEKACEDFAISKVVKIVVGGKTRQASVLCGFEAIDDKTKYVAIADGARCLTTPEQIKDVCVAAYRHKAATASHRSTDTVKIANDKGFIDHTADRDTVWLAQTPQVFKTKLYRAAAYLALRDDFAATDDNSLVEFIGHAIKLVECGSQNVKITTTEDMAVAEGILKARAEEQL